MVKKGYFYTESHEWVKKEGKNAVIGITDFAQHELGDIVYVELPEVDDEIEAGEAFGSVEAVKAVEDLICPVSGEVIAVNEALEDEPELINKSAFDKGWIIKVRMSDPDELDELMDAEAYQEMIEE